MTLNNGLLRCSQFDVGTGFDAVVEPVPLSCCQSLSEQVVDTSGVPWFLKAGSEDVSKNQFYLGFCWPFPVPSGPVTGWVSYPALMLMRFCGSAPVCLCGFCPADAACRWLPIYFDVLTLLWFRNLVGWVVADVSMTSVSGCLTSFVKCVTRVARISSSVSLQHGVSSFAHRFPCAFAATLVAAFVMLAAFAFVHSEAVAFSLVEPRRLPRCWPCRSSSCFRFFIVSAH